MELTVKRKIFTEKSTIGELSVDGVFLCYTLEDKDRGLQQSDSLAVIMLKKVFAVTAIPYGRYKVTITPSNRFKRDLPLISDVKGFAGVRIHPGNRSEDTEGCLLVGLEKYSDLIGRSREAFNKLYPLIDAAIKRNEQVFISFEK